MANVFPATFQTAQSAMPLTPARPAFLLGVAPSVTPSSATFLTAPFASKKTSALLVPQACLHQRMDLNAWFQRVLASQLSPSALSAKPAKHARLVTRITVYQLTDLLASVHHAPSITARNVIPTIFALAVFLVSSSHPTRNPVTSSSTKYLPV